MNEIIQTKKESTDSINDENGSNSISQKDNHNGGNGSSDMTGVNWMTIQKYHSRICLQNSTFATTPLKVMSLLHGTKNVTSNSHKNKDEDDNVEEREQVIRFMSRHCLILSNSLEDHRSKKNKYGGDGDDDDDEENMAFIAFRDNIQGAKNESGSIGSSLSLLDKFASLTLQSTSSSLSSTSPNDTNDKDVQLQQQLLLEIASQYIAVQLLRRESNDDTFRMISTQAKATNTTTDATSHQNNGSDVRKGGAVYNLSKTMFNKATSVFSSILASYDLIDDPHTAADMSSQDYMEDEMDDAVIFQREGKYLDDDNDDDAMLPILDLDQDDAASIILANRNGIISTRKGDVGGPSTAVSSLLSPSLLREDETAWNIQLLVQCLSIILNHAEKCLDDDTNYAHDDDANVAKLVQEEQITTCEFRNRDSNTNSTLIQDKCKGLMMNRWGDDENSFLKFCKRIGELLITSTTSTTTSLKSTMGERDTATTTSELALGHMLLNLKVGSISVQLLTLTLLSASKATLSDDGTVLILCPHNHVSYAIRTNQTISPTKQHLQSLKPDDIDIAIFKLIATRTSLERRMNNLTEQANRCKNQAILARKQSQNYQHKIKNSDKTALLHMKRYTIIQTHIEKCSSSLLNIETGLFNLQRARSDVQVLEAYDTLRSALKLVRSGGAGNGSGEGLSLENAVEVIDELNEENERLEDLHMSVTGDFTSGTNGGGDISKEELEKEFMALELEMNQEEKENNLKAKEQKEAKMLNGDNKYPFDDEENNAGGEQNARMTGEDITNEECEDLEPVPKNMLVEC